MFNNHKLIKNFLNSNKLMLSNNYSFNKSLKNGSIYTLNAEKIRTKIIDHFFSPINALSSKPNFIVSTDKVIVNVFYYILSDGLVPASEGSKMLKKEVKGLNPNTLNNLGTTLRKLFGRKVELQFVKINYPYLNRTILAKFIRMNTFKYKFTKLSDFAFRSTPVALNSYVNFNRQQRLDFKLPSHMVRMKIRVGGRLMSQRAKPRLSVWTKSLGKFNGKNNKDMLMELGSYTTKNKNGALTVQVWILHKMIP